MKTQLLLLPLLAVAPLGASAQPTSQTTAPKISIDPAAKALLDKATATYKGARSLRIVIAEGANGKERGTSTVSLSPTGFLGIARKSGTTSMQLLLDGHNFYAIQGTSYRKVAALPASTLQLLGAYGGPPGQFLWAMIEGKNPIETMQTLLSKPPFKNLRSNTVALGERVVDGESLSGVQSNLFFQAPTLNGGTVPQNLQYTVWFGGSPLMLRRIQGRTARNGKIDTITEKITDQQINQTFAPNTFKFDPTGMAPIKR